MSPSESWSGCSGKLTALRVRSKWQGHTKQPTEQCVGGARGWEAFMCSTLGRGQPATAALYAASKPHNSCLGPSFSESRRQK